MAVEYAGGRIVKKAGADLTGKKYYGVKLDNDGNVVVAGAGEAVAVLIEEGKAGASVTIQYCMETKMVAGAAIGAFVRGTTDAAGKLVAAIAGQKALVITLEAATAAKQIVPVCIIHADVPVTTLNELTDVVITTPTDGQVLKYESDDSTWKNAADAVT